MSSAPQAVSRSPLPHPKEIRDLLTCMLGREIELADTDAWFPHPTDQACVAEYVDDHGRLAVVSVADLPMCVYAGAALGLLPPGGAADMVEEKRPSTQVVENVYELLNIATSLFNKDGAPHVRIAAMHGPGGPLPPGVSAVAQRLNQRIDFHLRVPGYGAGRIAFVLA